MIAFSGRRILQIHVSTVLSLLSGACDRSLSMLGRSVGDVNWVVRVTHYTSGSLVMSDLGVWEMCIALLDKNVATHGHRCGGEGGRMELKEGWEMPVHMLLMWFNLTQGSRMTMMSVVWYVRLRRVCKTFIDFAVLCWIKHMLWWVLCDKSCAHIRLGLVGERWSL